MPPMNKRFKYPRTLHVPFSPGVTSDDKVLSNLDHFIHKEVVITLKMDGECSTLYPDYYSHARSLDSNNHPSRNWLKSFHSTIAHHIPENGRVCGENVYAKHSIEYNELESYFYVFSIWDSENCCYSWADTTQWCRDYGVSIVPELWSGIFDMRAITTIANNLDTDTQEGFVIRLSEGFHYNDFGTSVAKYVRRGHVITEDHWQYKTIVPNQLKSCQ